MPLTTPEEMAAIGTRIKVFRDLQGWTQQTLASMVFVSQASISQWENGVKIPSVPMQKRLCEALNVARDFVFAEAMDRAA